MADEDDIKQHEDADGIEQRESSKPEKTSKKTSGGILRWIIMFVAVALCGGAGFALGRFFAGFRTPEQAEHSQEEKPAQTGYIEAGGSAPDSQKTWYYDLDPLIANLNEPGITRYIRTALTLEINSEGDINKVRVFLDEKKPILTNWLTVYLTSLSLEDIRGDKNLMRIQSQIRDAFNEQLFPDSKPRIKHILFKEFAIQ